MKRNNIIILIVLIVVIVSGIVIGFVFSSKDSNNKVEKLVLTCDSDFILDDEEIVCTLRGNISNEVSAISSTIDVVGSGLKLEEVDTASIWEGDGKKGDIDLYTDVNKSGKFDIVTFTVSLDDEDKDEVTINLINNSYYDENYEEHKLDNVYKILEVRK